MFAMAKRVNHIVTIGVIVACRAIQTFIEHTSYQKMANRLPDALLLTLTWVAKSTNEVLPLLGR